MSDPSAIAPAPLTPPKFALPPLTPLQSAAIAAAGAPPGVLELAPAPAPTPASAPAAKPSVLDRLRAHKESQAGETSFVLPETGVTVTLPKYRSHDAWMKAQRMGKANSALVQVYYIIELAKFDGERLTAGDYRELIPAADHLRMINEVFNGGEGGGESDGEDAEKN